MPLLGKMEIKLLVLCRIILQLTAVLHLTNGDPVCYKEETIFACQNFKTINHLETAKFPIDMPATSLVKLYINNFDLVQIDPDAFHRMINLKVLDLSHNKLETLNPDWFYGLRNLNSLSFSHNLLRTFSDQDLLRNNNLLVHLDLSYNNISQFSSNVIDNLTEISTIKLENNPFLCDCELKNIKVWANERNVTINATCELPPSYTVVPWTHLDSINNCSKYLPSSRAIVHEHDISMFHLPINIPMWALLTSVMSIIVFVISVMCGFYIVNRSRKKRIAPATTTFSGINDDIMPNDYKFNKSADVYNHEDKISISRGEERYSRTPITRESVKCKNAQFRYPSSSNQNSLCESSARTQPNDSPDHYESVTSEKTYTDDGYLNPRKIHVPPEGNEVKYECIENDVTGHETQRMHVNLVTQCAYEHERSHQEKITKYVEEKNMNSLNMGSKNFQSALQESSKHVKNQHLRNHTSCIEKKSGTVLGSENVCYDDIRIEHEYCEDGYLKPKTVNTYSEIQVENPYEYIEKNSETDINSEKTLASHKQRNSSISHYECIENNDDVHNKVNNSKLKCGKKDDCCLMFEKNTKRNILVSTVNLFQFRKMNDTSASAVYDDVGNREDPCYMEIQEKH